MICPDDEPVDAVMPPGAVGAAASIFIVCVALALAFPAASVVKYTTLCDALSPLTVKVALAPALDTCPAVSTLRVTEPMPAPPSVPLTVTETAALYQLVELQAALLQVIDFVGAVRSEMPVFATLSPLVNEPPPVTWASSTYSYVPSELGVSE